MKSVQGDSGHAQMKMAADVYSHIIDEDRRVNAQGFEAAFCFGHRTAGESEPDGHTAESEKSGEEISAQELFIGLLNKPEIAPLIKAPANQL